MKIKTGMYVKIIGRLATAKRYGFNSAMETWIGKTAQVEGTLGDEGVTVGGWSWKLEDVVLVLTQPLSKEEKTQLSALLKG